MREKVKIKRQVKTSKKKKKTSKRQVKKKKKVKTKTKREKFEYEVVRSKIWWYEVGAERALLSAHFMLVTLPSCFYHRERARAARYFSWSPQKVSDLCSVAWAPTLGVFCRCLVLLASESEVSH